MPRALAVLAALSWIVAQPCAAAGALDGEWNVTSPLWAQAHVCTLRQAGGALTGICTGPRGHGQSTGGVAGNAVSWDWNDVTPRRTSVWHFSGALAADGVIRGTLRHGLQQGHFVARRDMALS